MANKNTPALIDQVYVILSSEIWTEFIEFVY